MAIQTLDSMSFSGLRQRCRALAMDQRPVVSKTAQPKKFPLQAPAKRAKTLWETADMIADSSKI